MPPDPRDDFYVGYLPLPMAQRRFLRVLIPSLLWTFVLFGGLLAVAQRDPGAATWDTGRPVTRTGTLLARPYPMLLADSQTGNDPEPIFLVEIGKRGAQTRAAPFAERRVTIRGWPLQRDGRRILELTPDENAIEDLAPAADSPQYSAATPAQLEGEIVDYKCYLGAMKPGDGKTHRSCAELCISGGIPPVLVVQREGGRRYLVVTGPGRNAAWVSGFAGEPVTVRGMVRSLGTAEFIEIQELRRAR
jgi:hypothetical protein